MGGTYYNEHDPFAAATTRELIKAGEIAPGVVDERDIRDVTPIELAGFTQCHFFAGGGVWSYALRRAGWRDEWPIWTGSCPCQPFSTAGKGLGFDDERHLWPAWDWLIDQCRPEYILGEQVADKGADAWLDLVQADLEAMDYAFGCVPLASAGFGAPNPRHRSFWMAYADRDGCGEARDGGVPAGHVGAIGDGAVVRLADAKGVRHERSGPARGRRHGSPNGGDALRLADPTGIGCSGIGRGRQDGTSEHRHAHGLADALRAGRAERRTRAGSGSTAGSRGDGNGDPGAVNGFWRDADWLLCRDPRGPRWRPVDTGTFPLAPRTAGGVGVLRVSGNAINAEVATGFIEAVMETLADRLAA